MHLNSSLEMIRLVHLAVIPYTELVQATTPAYARLLDVHSSKVLLVTRSQRCG